MASNTYRQSEMVAFKTAVQLEQILKKQDPVAAAGWLSRLEEIEKRLQAHKFRMAVVGEFNRGKSSLINVLLGKKILPEDVVATTATINRVTYGEKPRAYLVWKRDMQPGEEIPVEELSAYVTKLTRESEAKAAEIYEAVVEYPTMLCYHDVDLIDTPGMNDADDMNAVTVNRLTDIDLAVVTINAMYPFSETETRFVLRLLESANICQIIFVVTHIDLIRKRERNKLMTFLQTRIPENILNELRKKYPEEELIYRKYHALFDTPKIFAVSSAEAMEALERNDMEQFANSGFLRLNSDLPDIILSSRSVRMIENITLSLEEIIRDVRAAQAAELEKWDRLDRLPEQVLQDLRERADVFFHQVSSGNAKSAGTRIAARKELAVRRMLQSLGTLTEASATAVRQVLLPETRQAETEIGDLIDADILEQIRNAGCSAWLPGIREVANQVRSALQGFSDEETITAEITEPLAHLPELAFSEYTVRRRGEQLFFRWAEDPAESAIAAPVHSSILPVLTRMADASLAESESRISDCLQAVKGEMLRMAEERIRCACDAINERFAEERKACGERIVDPDELAELTDSCRNLHSQIRDMNQ